MSDLAQRNEFLPAPKNAQEAMQLAETLAASQLIPKNFQGKPNDVFVAMMWSANLGVPVLQGIQGIAVINNKPSIYGDLGLAVCMNSGLMEGIKEEIIEGSKKAILRGGRETPNLIARCTVRRKGNADPFVSEFSVQDAARAGLWEKQGPWTQYPKRMLQMRARAFALRNAFPDRLMGMSFAEEAMDIVDVNEKGEVTSVTPSKRMPKRKTEVQTAVEQQNTETVEPAKPTPEIENNPASDDLFAQQVMHVAESQPVPEYVEHKAVVEPVMTEVEKTQAATYDESSLKTRVDVEAALESMSTMDEVLSLWNQLKPDVQALCMDIFSAKRKSVEPKQKRG